MEVKKNRSENLKKSKIRASEGAMDGPERSNGIQEKKNNFCVKYDANWSLQGFLIAPAFV